MLYLLILSLNLTLYRHHNQRILLVFSSASAAAATAFALHSLSVILSAASGRVHAPSYNVSVPRFPGPWSGIKFFFHFGFFSFMLSGFFFCFYPFFRVTRSVNQSHGYVQLVVAHRLMCSCFFVSNFIFSFSGFLLKIIHLLSCFANLSTNRFRVSLWLGSYIFTCVCSLSSQLSVLIALM